VFTPTRESRALGTLGLWQTAGMKRRGRGSPIRDSGHGIRSQDATNAPAADPGSQPPDPGTGPGSPPWYVTEGQRGERLLAQGQVDAARAVFEDMLARLGGGPSYARAVALGRVAHCLQLAGRFDGAERYARQAVDVAEALATSDGVASLRAALRSELGDALRAAGRYDEAREAYEAALATARALSDARAQAVELGRLGALAAARGDAHEACTSFEAARRLFERVGDRSHLQRCLDALGGLLASIAAGVVPDLERYAPVIAAALARLGLAPTYGRAVLLGHLGRCWYAVGRPDLAVQTIRDALGVLADLPSSDEVTSLRGFLIVDLGDGLRAVGRDADAQEAYRAALAVAEERQDVRGLASVSERLGQTTDVRSVRHQPDHQSISALPFEITVFEDVAVDHVFDPDLLIDGPRERRAWRPSAVPLEDSQRPRLAPSVRTWVDEDGAVWFDVPLGEPRVDREPSCTVLCRRRREVRVSTSQDVLWRVVRGTTGEHTVADIVSGLGVEDRGAAARLLGALAGAGVVDVSGRALGRFVHQATKKGVLPAGGLVGDEVLQLAADGEYRAYPEVPRIALRSDVPERLRPFHALTRARRSTRDYRGGVVARADIEALLHTACGVTGTTAIAGRELPLRAYPSSGALYAVEIYPLVFRVEGLEPAVYHYRAIEHALEVVRPAIDPAVVVRAALPVEREMVAGAAALICLTGRFPRHERKYGEGGYRMLVAEAGHISQNLVLAATALGLRARPFGGVFDDLLNQDLGLDASDEQFLLAVLLGAA